MQAEEPRFGFYEKVRISTTAPNGQELNGKLGAVLGRAQDEAGEWFYAVYIYQTEMVWNFPEPELLSTGEFDVESNFYDGSSTRVHVDKRGRGTTAE